MDSEPMTKNGWEITFRSDLAVIGYNSESADMSNPRGEIQGFECYALAENEDGRRFSHNGTLAVNYSETVAHKMAEDALPDLYAALPDAFNPEEADDWRETSPAYGSVAYQRAEPDIVAAERDDGFDPFRA